jgi:hypothetical protein
MQAIKPLIISPTILGASREIQCFPQIRTFGDGQVCTFCCCGELSNNPINRPAWPQLGLPVLTRIRVEL